MTRQVRLPLLRETTEVKRYQDNTGFCQENFVPDHDSKVKILSDTMPITTVTMVNGKPILIHLLNVS